ncbi:MAG TPA: DUF4331 family protein [Candidatus Xenobia bacterium]
MKHFSKPTLLGAAILGVLGGSTLLIGCSGSGNNPSLNQFVFFPAPTPVVTTTAAAPTFTQVEQFGRPGINEALFITNAFLNGYNATQPQVDLQPANQNPPGPVIQSASGGNITLTALGTEAATTLTAFATPAGDSERVLDEVRAFLPDVMRIDTTISSPVGTPAYGNGAAIVENGAIVSAATLGRTVPVLMPRAGRKLEDDVIDTTLTVLTDGAVTSDNVFFNDTASAGAATHHLNHQTTSATANQNASEGGTATFPYLGPPQ